MSTKKPARVTIPKNVEDHLLLASKVYEKHCKDGEASPLHVLTDPSWANTEEHITMCLVKHREAEELKRQMEQAYRERDLLFPQIDTLLRNSKNLLKSV